MKARWTQVNGAWAVRVEGAPEGESLVGKSISVEIKGKPNRNVLLGAMIESDGNIAKYKPAPRVRGAERQPDSERSRQTYTVAVRVQNAKGEWVQWEQQIESTDELLLADTSIEVARCAVNVRDVLTAGVRTTSVTTKKAAPKRPSRATKAKPATKRKAVA